MLIVPVEGNPVVESTVIVVAVFVRAPFNRVEPALLPVGLQCVDTPIVSKNVYTLV